MDSNLLQQCNKGIKSSNPKECGGHKCAPMIRGCSEKWNNTNGRGSSVEVEQKSRRGKAPIKRSIYGSKQTWDCHPMQLSMFLILPTQG